MKGKQISLIGTALVLVIGLLLLIGCSSSASPPATTSQPATPTSSPSASAASSTPTASTAANPGQITLTVFGAGTLAGPFKDIDTAFEQANSGINVQPQFGGSVAMAHKITQLHQPADILAVADYNVIPNTLYASTSTPSGTPGGSPSTSPAYANWYIGFVSNAMTWMYTDKSKGASTITSDNWYQVLSQPGVQVGRSNPNTDPSGYQILQMLQLANQYYNVPGLSQNILANSPQQNVRDTETDLIAALQSGQIDYLGIYASTAIQENFKYLKLPPQIDLSDASMAAQYAKASAQTSAGAVTGSPIIYAITIPSNAPHPQAAQQFINFLISSQGQAIMQKDGFQAVNPAIASGLQNVPAGLQAVVKAWPTTTPATLSATPVSTP